MCWPWNHKWEKWKVVAEGYLKQQYDGLTGVKLQDHEQFIRGSFEKQRRECTVCGKSQLRRTTA
jgi:hypothetical protein